jgi:hypothetical protein
MWWQLGFHGWGGEEKNQGRPVGEEFGGEVLGFDSRELPNSNRRVNDTQQVKENGTENDVNNCQSNLSLLRVPVRVYL